MNDEDWSHVAEIVGLSFLTIAGIIWGLDSFKALRRSLDRKEDVPKSIRNTIFACVIVGGLSIVGAESTSNDAARRFLGGLLLICVVTCIVLAVFDYLSGMRSGYSVPSEQTDDEQRGGSESHCCAKTVESAEDRESKIKRELLHIAASLAFIVGSLFQIEAIAIGYGLF